MTRQTTNTHDSNTITRTMDYSSRDERLMREKQAIKKIPDSPETRHCVPATVLGTQVGGSHYTDCAIQPIEYIWANKLGFSEGNIVKYITRWRSKGGIKDLEKAQHHIALLIEHETAVALHK